MSALWRCWIFSGLFLLNSSVCSWKKQLLTAIQGWSDGVKDKHAVIILCVHVLLKLLLERHFLELAPMIHEKIFYYKSTMEEAFPEQSSQTIIKLKNCLRTATYTEKISVKTFTKSCNNVLKTCTVTRVRKIKFTENLTQFMLRHHDSKTNGLFYQDWTGLQSHMLSPKHLWTFGALLIGLQLWISVLSRVGRATGRCWVGFHEGNRKLSSL